MRSVSRNIRTRQDLDLRLRFATKAGALGEQGNDQSVAPWFAGGTESGPVRSDSWFMHIPARMVGGRAATEVHPMALPPDVDPTAHRVHDRVSRPPEPSNWRRHGPYLRTLAVAIVLTAAAASAGMLMALMGD